MKIPRTAVWLLSLAILLNWIPVIFIEGSLQIPLICASLVLAVLAWTIITGSFHNQRLERLGREADAQNRPPGLRGGAS